MLGGWLFLDEMPTAPAAGGVVLVTVGVYCIGLRPGASALEPLRALARERASWFAVAAAVAWSITTLIHKFGIAAVGPFPWGVTLAIGSGLLLAAALPVMGRRTGGWRSPFAGFRGAVRGVAASRSRCSRRGCTWRCG